MQSLCAKMVRPEGAAPAKMSEEQRWVAGVAGGMKFPEKVNPRYSLPVWHLASVMSNPPMPEARQLGVLLLENAWAHRNDLRRARRRRLCNAAGSRGPSGLQ